MPVLEKITQRFPQAVLETHAFRGDETALVKKESIHGVLEFLKTGPELDFNVLMDIAGVDYLHFDPAGQSTAPQSQTTPAMSASWRFEVVYHLYSVAKKQGPVVLKVRAPRELDQCRVPSLTPLWRGCEFQEREAYDLVGIHFEGHPDLRRILMWEGFEHYPLRKDYVQEDQDREIDVRDSS